MPGQREAIFLICCDGGHFDGGFFVVFLIILMEENLIGEQTDGGKSNGWRKK